MNSLVHKPRIAFQGAHGAFSEEAANHFFEGNIETVPRKTFTDLFRSLDDEVADYILAPVENTITGPVEESVRLMTQRQWTEVGDVEIRVAQHLIACPGAEFSELRTVQSHPVALRQCQKFLAANPQIEPREADDTAGSVAEIMLSNDHSRAAIAGRSAADFYHAAILKEAIQDQPNNFTRFVLLFTEARDK